jgi:hypothetical protein
MLLQVLAAVSSRPWWSRPFVYQYPAKYTDKDVYWLEHRALVLANGIWYIVDIYS